jgi:hypothetical protein
MPRRLRVSSGGYAFHVLNRAMRMLIPKRQVIMLMENDVQKQNTWSCILCSKVTVTLGMSFLLLTLLVAGWWYPKHNKFNLSDPYSIDLYYRGFGLTEQPGLFGKNYYLIKTILTYPEDGLCYIECCDKKNNPFLAYYPNGNIRAKGSCILSYDQNRQPMCVLYVEDGIFYRPDEKTTSEMYNGAGE